MSSSPNAGVLIRALAQIIDFLFLSMFFFPITYMVKGTWLMSRADHIWSGIFDPICAVFLVVIFAYYIMCEAWFGGTVGKLLLGLRIRSVNGGRITMRQSLIRNILRIVDGIACNLVGVVLILRSPMRQRYGDRVAGTVVVAEKLTD
jgi:uncharacterized RDD family membrane protein YckC